MTRLVNRQTENKINLIYLIKLVKLFHSELEKLDSGRKERNGLSSVVRSLAKQAVRAFRGVPEGRHPELLQLIENFVENAKHEPVKPIPTTPEEAKALGITLYKELTKVEKKKTGKELVKQGFGYMLKEFTPTLDRDYFCQADLEKCDKPLLNRLRKDYTSEELNKFLPKIELFNQQIAQTMTEEERREIYRMNGIIQKAQPRI